MSPLLSVGHRLKGGLAFPILGLQRRERGKNNTDTVFPEAFLSRHLHREPCLKPDSGRVLLGAAPGRGEPEELHTRALQEAEEGRPQVRGPGYLDV